MRPFASGLATAAAAGFGVLAAASAPQVQRPPVFRAGANFVLVDVYPQRDGRIVEGLAASDFEVFEDGRVQTVESVEFVRIEPGLSESTRRDPNNQREMLEAAADPTNRVFVVYLDVPHVTIEGSFAIRRPLVTALNRIIGPDDLFGVLVPTVPARLLVLGRRLLSVEDQLARNWPWGERHRLGTDPNDPVEAELEACFRVAPGTSQEWLIEDGAVLRPLYRVLIERRREDRTLASLDELVAHAGTLREARTVVLVVTDGWRLFRPDRALAEKAGVQPAGPPGLVLRGGRLGAATELDVAGRGAATCNAELLRLADLDNERRFRDVIARATRHNVSFYPVNPAGLAAFDTPISEPVVLNSRADPSESVVAQEMARVRDRVSGLRTLADNTGGIAVVETNDLDAGLRRVVDDVSAYYLLGYYSTNRTFDGRYRRIEVRVATPGVRVKARPGYIAPDPRARQAEPPGEPAAEAPGRAAAVEALGVLGRLRPDAELFVHATAAPQTIRVAVEIGASTAGRAPWTDGASVTATVTTEAGEVVGTASDRIEPATRGVLLVLPRPADVAGPWLVGVAVGAGAGALRDRVPVRAPDGAILSEATLFRATPSPRSPLVAAADFQFSRRERVHAEWPVAGGPLDRREARLLDATGRPLAVPVTLTEREQDGQAMLVADLALAPLAPGDYVLEVTAGRGDRTEQAFVAIRVSR